MLLPDSVKSEPLVSLLLGPLLPADMGRDYTGLILACDAAPVYGFGVSMLRCGREIAAGVGRKAERRGDYVRFQRDEEEPVPMPRLGKPHHLPFHQRDFTPLISCRARWQAHSGVLEAHGLLMTVRWYTRTRRHQHTRIPILVDAKVVLGCAVKGRSSSRALRGILRALAAHQLGADILLRLVYVPTDENAADAPSRGVKHAPKAVSRSRRQRRRDLHRCCK